LIRPIDDPTLPWLGTLVGLPILGFYYWATNQYIVQRVLGSRDLKNGRWGTLFGGSLKLLPLFIMVLPGALAWKLFPGLENPDKVFPTMVAELLPPGVTGLVLAGLIAAIMSSIDSTLNSASTLVTIDFVQPRRKDLSPKQTARVGRLATVGFMLVAALWAPFIGIFGGLFSYLQTAFSYVVPPVVVIFIMGVFWRRGSGAAAFVTLVGGHLLSAGLFVAGPVTGMVEVHFAIMAGVLTGACVLLYVAAALIAKPAAEEKTLGLTWASRVRDGRLRASGSAWKDYRIQAALLVAATVVVVVFFW
jgi:SSS family solute:Na+ symporter